MQADTAVATYLFQNNHNAQQGGAPALAQIGTGVFGTDTVFGNSRTVLNNNGSAGVGNNAGLTLDTTSLLSSSTTYSVEMVFKFTERSGQWRKILDYSDRTSDSDFYVDPSNRLHFFNTGATGATWTNDVYHHVVLTDSAGTVNAYLDGTLAFTTSTALADLANNPGHLLHFFVDDGATGFGEYSQSSVALVRLYNKTLSGSEVKDLAKDPFAPSVPEPAFYQMSALLTLGGLGVLRMRRRR